MRARITVAPLVMILLAGCSFSSGDPVVDGWPVGPEIACSADPACPTLLATATIGFDRRNPGHPTVVNVTLHDEGATVDANGNLMITKRGGACCSVARFELTDGTVRAIGVGYPGISQTPMVVDYGP